MSDGAGRKSPRLALWYPLVKSATTIRDPFDGAPTLPSKSRLTGKHPGGGADWQAGVGTGASKDVHWTPQFMVEASKNHPFGYTQGGSGVLVHVKVCVSEGVEVEVSVGVEDGENVGVAVRNSVGVIVFVGVEVARGSGVCVCDVVGVGVEVEGTKVEVIEYVNEGVGVTVAEGVKVSVEVGTPVGVLVTVKVAVGDSVGVEVNVMVYDPVGTGVKVNVAVSAGGGGGLLAGGAEGLLDLLHATGIIPSARVKRANRKRRVMEYGSRDGLVRQLNG